MKRKFYAEWLEEFPSLSPQKFDCFGLEPKTVNPVHFFVVVDFSKP